MGFLAPAFLAGLAALAIPVVIHLINRERKEVVPFPSLMFLQKIPYRSVRRQKLRHLLLLTLRCLALAIVVAAFARPFLRRDRAAGGAASNGARELVVLIDRSYSMGFGDRWARAQNAARRAVADIGGSDRATIIAFDETAAALTAPTADRGTLTGAVGALHPGSQATRYGPALKLASQILAGSNLPRREVVLVSDFQRRGWTGAEETTLPAGTRFTPVDVSGDTALADLGVANVSVQRSDAGARDRVIVAARLTNTGAAAVTVPATLVVNGREAETQKVAVPARGAAQVRFTAIAIPSGTSSGMVQLGSAGAAANHLAANDRFYFTASPDASLSVLVLEPASPRPSQSLYFERALEIGDRPSFRVDVKPASAFVPADLSGRSLVVLDEVAPPEGEAGARLRAFVESGGGLLLAAGDRLTGVGGSWAALLPGSIGPLVDRGGEAGGTLAWVDYSHPIFELFNAPHSGDFASARFLRYRPITIHADSAHTAADSTRPRVVARFDDGSAALAERTLGSGRVAVWASTLDTYWNDLPLQPVFLPFVHELARVEGRYSDARPWFTAGDVLEVGRGAGGGGRGDGAVVVESPSGERTRYPAAARTLIPLREQGLYEVRGERTAPGDGRRVDVHLDPAEAELARLDTAELRSALTSTAATTTAGARVLDAPSREEQERHQTLWWYLLAAAGVMLVADTLLSNRLSKV